MQRILRYCIYGYVSVHGYDYSLLLPLTLP